MKKIPKKVHFTGIKGVGMTATALCFQDLGSTVRGSDVAEEFVTDEILKKRKIIVAEGFSEDNIAEGTDLLVYTGAHKGIDNEEVVLAKQKGIKVISQAEAVGRLMVDKVGISVGGVGGKTTTSSMIATVLEESSKKPSYLIGVGEIKGLGVPGKYSGEGEHFVAEADEYVVGPGTDNTTRFMFQAPKVLVITNLAYDHPDVYESFEETKRVFGEFIGKLPHDGVLVINGDDEELVKLAESSGKRVVSFGEGERNRIRLLGVEFKEEVQIVSMMDNKEENNFSLQVPGKYNAMNALASFMVCRELGLSSNEILKGLESYGGIKRRFERIAEKDGVVYFDDYAHHPSEVRAVLKGAKSWLPGKRIVALFQPHTYSRTKALLDEFATSFSDADEVIITDIFASARESVDNSVTGELLADKVAKNHPKAIYVSSDDLVKYCSYELKAGDAFFTLGAGDIYKLHNSLFVLGQAQI